VALQLVNRGFREGVVRIEACREDNRSPRRRRDPPADPLQLLLNRQVVRLVERGSNAVRDLDERKPAVPSPLDDRP